MERLYVSDNVATKLGSKHGLSHYDICDAIEKVEKLLYKEHDHPDRGLRMYVPLKIGKLTLMAILYPTDDPTCFNLGTVIRQ